MIHPLVRQVPDGVFSTTRTPIRIVGERRSSEDETPDEAETEAPAPPKDNTEELKRWDIFSVNNKTECLICVCTDFDGVPYASSENSA